MKELIIKIKKKKELQGLSDNFVKDILQEYLTKRNIREIKGKKSEKIVIKIIRAELRKYAGRYQYKTKINRFNLLKKGRIKEILKTHTSTKERIESKAYPKLIKIINKLNPNSILDLGCGLNPLAIANKLNKNVKYYTCDIKEDELKLLSEFFKKEKIKGKVFYADLRKENKFPKTDLCLLLKILDIIEPKGHRLAEKIVKNLKCRNIIVSFSTKTLSGRPMKYTKREWLEKFLIRLNYSFKILKTNNEIFYTIQKTRADHDL